MNDIKKTNQNIAQKVRLKRFKIFMKPSSNKQKKSKLFH